MQSEPPTAWPRPADSHVYRFRPVDRRAIARAERRRQAIEELELERDRAVALHDEIARIVVELDGPELDEAAFAEMSPEDVEVVRSAIQGPDPSGPEGSEEWLELAGGEEVDVRDEEAERAELEAEIQRIEGEIEASTRRQQAFERYLEALGE